MKKLTGRKVMYILIAGVLVIALFLLPKTQARQVKVSEFGIYRGYSEAFYDGNERRSEYLKLSNGIRLAYDLILPSQPSLL